MNTETLLSKAKEADTAKVTIIIAPRERFEQATMSLTSLFETIDMPVSLIYVDGATPEPIASDIRKLIESHGHTYIRSERFLSPNQARNLAMKKVNPGAKYIVFADNDVLFTPGWLSSMVNCAEETGAGLVSPTILVGPEGRMPDLKIHHAGGALSIHPQSGGHVVFSRQHGHEHLRYLDVKDQLVRRETDCTEFHTVLTRKDMLDQIGPFDEQIVGFSDEVDMALLARQCGWKIWFEPASVITYATGKKLTWNDLPYFCARWEGSRCINAEKHFYAKWGLKPDFDRQRRFLRDHRRHAFPFKRLQKLIGWRATVLLTTVICQAIALTALPRFAPIRRETSNASPLRPQIGEAHASVYA
ncbi:MAG: glycosyltransferase [Hyphomonas sp.]|uniref:glycosyltransferase family 2 protein n=1 Tax=Hyphomonas sp. TaxID=87 RepID=UPI003527D3B8